MYVNRSLKEDELQWVFKAEKRVVAVNATSPIPSSQSEHDRRFTRTSH